MKTLTAQAEITADQILRLELPCDLPAGAVEVVVVVQPQSAAPPTNGRDWDALYGLGQEIWRGVDPKEYVQELRQDRETP